VPLIRGRVGRVGCLMLQILSLGAGVQSSALLLMSCRGDLPKLDAAIFADTGWEPKGVYETLEWLTVQSELAGIPMYVVRKGNLRDDAMQSQVRGISGEGRRSCVRSMSMPLFTKQQDGKKGQIRRQCTLEYKIGPIEKKTKELLGIKPRQRMPKEVVVQQWMGISSDEARRARLAKTLWQEFVYPFLGLPQMMLDKTYSRAGILRWLSKHYPDREFPRSACIGCPFKSDNEWRNTRENSEEWEDALEFDRAIRHSGGMRGEMYLHQKLIPLEEIDLSTDIDHGQQMLWNQECEGMCGL